MRIGSLLVVVWLLIGAAAAIQRGYVNGDAATCANAGTITVTVIAGPLNYLGVNPTIEDCNIPEPSA